MSSGNISLKSTKIIFGVLALFIVLLITIIAFSFKTETTTEVTSSLNNPSKYTIDHTLGKTVIQDKPKRVVSLFQGATDSLIALGITPVGVVESWSQKPMYNHLRTQLSGVTYIGLETQPSLEDIKLLKPDLIIASRFRNEAIYPTLSQIAPTVVLEDVFNFRETLKVVGNATKEDKKASELLHDWDNRIAQTSNSLNDKFGKNWTKKLSLLEIRADHIRSYSPKSFSGNILTDLGFHWTDLVVDENWALKKLPSKESIPFIDADVFLIFMRENPSTLKNYNDWKNHPLWMQTKAYKNNSVYHVDSVHWNLGGGIISANYVLDEIDDIFDLKKPPLIDQSTQEELKNTIKNGSY